MGKRSDQFAEMTDQQIVEGRVVSKARELSVGDVFGLSIYGEVVEASSVADGKRIKIKLPLQDQATGLEFLDAGCTPEFLCRPGREFHVWNERDDDDNDDDDDREVAPNPTGGGSLKTEREEAV
jgi:hypothetical protein